MNNDGEQMLAEECLRCYGNHDVACPGMGICSLVKSALLALVSGDGGWKSVGLEDIAVLLLMFISAGMNLSLLYPEWSADKLREMGRALYDQSLSSPTDSVERLVLKLMVEKSPVRSGKGTC